MSKSSIAVVAAGINHKTAPIELRERLAFNADNTAEVLQTFVAAGHGSEAALLSTCNRTEVYCTHTSAKPVLHWLSDYCDMEFSHFQPYTYTHFDQAAVSHMLRVASGLDSMVLGETQIFQQMKQAYQTAQAAGTLGSLLHRIFQYVFQSTKQIRHQTAIGANPVSIAFAAASLAKRIFSHINETTVMLLGAGDTITLTAKHLRQMGCQRFLVANRNLTRAKELAQELGAEALSIDHLINRLPEADILISATRSRLPIVGKGSIEAALKKRKHKPMYLIDLGVPRDIEPQANELSDVFLYDIDDLKDIVTQGLQHRKQAAQHAEQIILTQTSQFMESVQALDSVKTIKALRAMGKTYQTQCIENALVALKRGKSVEKVIQQLGLQLTNKLLHFPCKQLHHAARQQNQDLLDSVARLFELEVKD